MSKLDQHGVQMLNEGDYCFRGDNPCRRYLLHLENDENESPKLSILKGMICDLEDLQLLDENQDEQTLQNCKNYTKMVSILLHLFMTTGFFSWEGASGGDDKAHEIRNIIKHS